MRFTNMSIVCMFYFLFFFFFFNLLLGFRILQLPNLQ